MGVEWGYWNGYGKWKKNKQMKDLMVKSVSELKIWLLKTLHMTSTSNSTWKTVVPEELEKRGFQERSGQ